MNIYLLAVLIVGGTLTFTAGGVLIFRPIVRRYLGSSHNEVMISLFGAAGVIYAVLLGFLVVVVWESYDGAHQNLGQEAATLVPLYRLTYGMEAQEGAKFRTLIRQYAHAVIDDEWPQMGAVPTGSAKARRAIGAIDHMFATMDRATKAADAQVDGEFLDLKSVVVADRNQRLLKATDTIPWVMWLGAVGGGVIVIFMSFLIYMERAQPHVVMASFMGALVGLLLFIMAAMSNPFTGPLALSADHFRQALAIMDDDDRGD
ncbi:MAG TPA: hypothetical protein VH000_07650 [Rhizomicrobium sp.]|nr:hypothetical protein [Rhizomicrobium sp.]